MVKKIHRVHILMNKNATLACRWVMQPVERSPPPPFIRGPVMPYPLFTSSPPVSGKILEDSGFLMLLDQQSARWRWREVKFSWNWQSLRDEEDWRARGEEEVRCWRHDWFPHPPPPPRNLRWYFVTRENISQVAREALHFIVYPLEGVFYKFSHGIIKRLETGGGKWNPNTEKCPVTTPVVAFCGHHVSCSLSPPPTLPPPFPNSYLPLGGPPPTLVVFSPLSLSM